ncbi:MAG TPA: ABC transporter permease, partial [Chthoniobacterales bacterium]
METTLNDIRYGLRMLRKNVGFTVVAVLAITLGIASTTVIFSVVNRVLLRSLPYPDADRIMYVSQTVRSQARSRDAASPANYLDWVAQNGVFSAMAAARGTQANLTDGDQPERLRVCTTTASLFQVFGVNAILGRTLLPADESPGNARVLVLSHGLWQRRFGGDKNIIERDIRLNGEPHRVVGVMPAGFAPDNYGELWLAS